MYLSILLKLKKVMILTDSINFGLYAIYKIYLFWRDVVKKNLSLIVLFVLYVNLFSVDYEVMNSLKWGTLVLPPIHNIDEGEFKNMGCSDELIKLFNKHFNLTVAPEVYPAKRLINNLKNFEALANPILKKTKERAEFLYYSKLPTAFMPSHVIVVTKKHYEQLKKKSLSLEEILSDNKNRVGLQVARSYGKTLDQIISKTKESSEIYYDYRSNPYRSLLDKLNGGVLDFVVGYPMEIEYLKKQLNLENLRYLYIDELADEPYHVSYFGISKTAKGKQIIEQVDSVLSDLRRKKEYKKFFERWISKDLLEEYRKDYNLIFLKNKIK